MTDPAAVIRSERRRAMRDAQATRLQSLEACTLAALDRAERRRLVDPDPLAGDPAAIAERNNALRAILTGGHR